jgi:hypothetical protein
MAIRKIVLDVVECLVIIPTTIVAAVLGFAGALVALITLIRSEHNSSPYMLLSLIAVGWFGVFTLWKLQNHFHRTAERPGDILLCWLGLLCGSAASVILIVSSGGTVLFRLLFFGWTMLVVIVFSIMLLNLTRHKKTATSQS